MSNITGNFHDASQMIQTTGIVSDGKHLALASTQQFGFKGWVRTRTVAASFCGGDYEGRVSLPKGWSEMPIVHEAELEAKESIELNGNNIKAGRLYAAMPGRRLCIQSPDKACPLGDMACGHYVNRGTTRYPGYGTLENFEDPRYLIELPDALADFGFMVEQAAITNHLIRTAIELRLLPQKHVALLGLGVLGLLTAAELVDMGCNVIGFDAYANGPRREVFEMLGARTTFLKSEPKAVQMHAGAFGLVIELAGGHHSLADALELVGMGGTILAGGIPMVENAVTEPKLVVTKGATIKGIVSAERIDYLKAVNSMSLWLHARPEFLQRLVTHRLHYTEFERALHLIDPQDRIKVALSFS